MRKLMLFAVAASVSGCQTWGPTWSELSGQRYTMTSAQIEVGPTVINQIDGLTPDSGPLAPTRITPGLHKVVLQAVPPGGVMGLIHLEEITFDAKPCIRYYINARFKASTGTDWAPFVDYQEPIPGCQVPAGGAAK